MLLDAENTKVDNTEKVSPLLVSHSGVPRDDGELLQRAAHVM